MTELKELLERVKAVTGPDRELDAGILCAFPPFGVNWKPDGKWTGRATFEHVIGDGDSRSAPSYTYSIDVALTLALRLLPHHRFAVFTDGQGRGPCCLIMVGDEPVIAQEFGKTLPLAILAALLSALIAKESSNDQ